MIKNHLNFYINFHLKDSSESESIACEGELTPDGAATAFLDVYRSYAH